MLVESAGVPGGLLPLDLFPDTTLIARLVRVEEEHEDGFTWVGVLEGEGDELSSVVLVLNDKVVIGNVTSICSASATTTQMKKTASGRNASIPDVSNTLPRSRGGNSTNTPSAPVSR